MAAGRSPRRSSSPRGTSPSPVRVPKQARSRRTRARILAAAADCFEARGYDATTTAQIARQARIAVGSVYDYFPDKRAILLELLRDTTARMAEPVVRGLAPSAWVDTDPRESVRKLLELVFRSRTLQPGLQRILWERFFKDPGFREAMEATEDRIRGAIVELLHALRAQGRTRVVDPVSAAFVIHLSVEWTASRLVLGGAEVPIDAAVDAATEMITRYLFDDPG